MDSLGRIDYVSIVSGDEEARSPQNVEVFVHYDDMRMVARLSEQTVIEVTKQYILDKRKKRRVINLNDLAQACMCT